VFVDEDHGCRRHWKYHIVVDYQEVHWKYHVVVVVVVVVAYDGDEALEYQQHWKDLVVDVDDEAHECQQHWKNLVVDVDDEAHECQQHWKDLVVDVDGFGQV